MPATTDPAVAAWRRAVATLGSELVAIESDPTVALARAGGLEGGSGATWAEADTAIADAWTTYHAVNQLVVDAEADPSRAGAMLATATVPTGGTTADPTTAMRAAKAMVEAAAATVARLATAWNDWAGRMAAVNGAATAAGDTAITRAAVALGDLLVHDPLAVTEADVVQIEAGAAAATSRHNASELAAARLDLDLAAARTAMAALETDVRASSGEVGHAATRIVGVSPTAPVPDIDALAGWLDRIATAADHDPSRAAADLDDWMAAAEARREELDRALAPARDGMRRRDEGRGLWRALRAKAAAKRLDENADVAIALKAAQDELWQAPCDLDAAEAALTLLAGLLDSHGGSVR